MENKDEKIVLSSGDNVLNFKVPDWNKSMSDAIKDSPLYKLAAKPGKLQGESNMVMLEQSVTTNGWDTVSICRVSALNAKIIADKTYPDHMDIIEPGGAIALDGDFGPWQVVTGGDGKNVKIHIPFNMGNYKGINMGRGDAFDISNVSVDILVKLQYFPLVTGEVMEDGDYTLTVSTDSPSPTEPIAAVINLTDPSGLIDDVNKSILKGEIEKWLNIPENLKSFDTLFATVMINNMGESSKDFAWLKSTYTSYAYTDHGTDESSIFGILCMTNNNPHDNLPNQLPAVSLKAENNALFVISREAFVKYQLLPALPEIFEGTSSSDYILDESGLVVNATNIQLDPVKVGLINYYPVATKFEIAFDDSYIQTTVDVDCEVSPGIVSKTTIISKQTLVMGYNDNHEKIMTYQNVGEPTTVNSVDVAVGIIITEAILGIIASIVTVVAGKIAGKIAAIVVGIIVAFIVATISIIIHVIIEKAIAEGIQAAIPSVEPMVKVAASQVKWPFCCEGGLDLTGILYSGSITLEGNLAIEEQFQIQNGRLICA